MTYLESLAHIAAAAALSAGMIGVGFGALAAVRRGMTRLRPIWLVAGAGGAAFTLYVANAELRWDLREPAVLWAGVALILGVIAGGALLSRGLRGRHVGDHEHCRRCGFDLFGRPADARVCNECGTPLDAPRAIVIGVRRRRPVALVTGAFLLVACLAIGGSAGRAVFAGGRQLSLAPYKPTAWLLRDARGNSEGAYEASRELLRRLAAGSLGDENIRAIAADAAARRVGGNAAAIELDIAVAGWERGVVDEATIRQIVRQQATLSFGVASNDVAPNRVTYQLLPAGPLGWRWPAPAGWSFTASERVDRVGDRVLPPDAIESSPIVETGWGARPVTASLGNVYRLDAAPLPDGPAAFTATMQLTATLAANGRPPISETTSVTCGAAATVVADDSERVPVLSDGDADRQFGETMTATVNAPVDGWATIDLNTPAAAWPLAGHAFVGDAFAVDAQGREARLGEALVQNGLGVIRPGAGRVPAGAFSIVLRPMKHRPPEAAVPGAFYLHEVRIDASRVTRAYGG